MGSEINDSWVYFRYEGRWLFSYPTVVNMLPSLQNLSCLSTETATGWNCQRKEEGSHRNERLHNINSTLSLCYSDHFIFYCLPLLLDSFILFPVLCWSTEEYQ